MPSPRRFAVWGLVALMAGSLGLQAQEAASPFSMDWKMRVGYAPSAKDHLRQNSLGFGFNTGYKLSDSSKVNAELGYYYKTGDFYYTMPDTTRIAAGRPALDTAYSIEERRNEFEGLTLRVSYQEEISPSFAWQAGVQIGGRYKQQIIADVRSQQYSASAQASVNPNSYHDIYVATPTKANFVPSPFAGITWHIDKESSLEFNLVLFSYKSAYYKHYAGAAGTTYWGGVHQDASGGLWMGPYQTEASNYPADTVETHTSVSPHLEVAYVLHF